LGSAARPDLGNLLAMGCHHETPTFFANFAEQTGKGAVCLGGRDKLIHGITIVNCTTFATGGAGATLTVFWLLLAGFAASLMWALRETGEAKSR
jgi:hypothetical protein